MTPREAVSDQVDRPCRRCGMKIRFLLGPNGKRIPAQRVRTVYRIAGGLFDTRRLEVVDVGEAYVSHFETCPNASEFSHGKKGG